MDYLRLGTSGLEVSRVILGCMSDDELAQLEAHYTPRPSSGF